jgi:hypothetical protein
MVSQIAGSPTESTTDSLSLIVNLEINDKLSCSVLDVSMFTSADTNACFVYSTVFIPSQPIMKLLLTP